MAASLANPPFFFFSRAFPCSEEMVVEIGKLIKRAIPSRSSQSYRTFPKAWIGPFKKMEK